MLPVAPTAAGEMVLAASTARQATTGHQRWASVTPQERSRVAVTATRWLWFTSLSGALQAGVFKVKVGAISTQGNRFLPPPATPHPIGNPLEAHLLKPAAVTRSQRVALYVNSPPVMGNQDLLFN